MKRRKNTILIEAEDYSDDFFQSKHIEKRKKDLIKQLEIRKAETLSKLQEGLERVRIAYYDRKWEDEKERVFLRLFSELYLWNRQEQYEYKYYLSNSYSNEVTCIYNIKTMYFWILYRSIWTRFETELNMERSEIQSFLITMLEKYLNLQDIIVQ